MRCRPDEKIFLYPASAEISSTPFARLETSEFEHTRLLGNKHRFANVTFRSCLIPSGTHEILLAADPVYHLLGTDGIETDKWPPPGLPLVTTLGYFMHDGGHGTLPYDWQVFINFLNIQLRAKMN